MELSQNAERQCKTVPPNGKAKAKITLRQKFSSKWRLSNNLNIFYLVVFQCDSIFLQILIMENCLNM